MKIDDYIRLSNVSNKVVSQMCIFGFIGAYIRFMGFSYGILAICTLIYFLLLGVILYYKREGLNKPQMSYVVHPLYFGAVILGFFITVIESSGTDLNVFLIYVVFLIALYMVNCYISAFTVKISSTTTSKAATVIKYSVKQNIMFLIWLACFVLAGVLVIFIPTSGIGAIIISAIRMLFGKINLSDAGEGQIEEAYVNEEPLNSDVTGEHYEDNTMLAILLSLLIISLVLIIIYLARKIFSKDDKPVSHLLEINSDIVEEVSDISENIKIKKEKISFLGSPEAKIRRYFANTVNSYYEKVNTSKTPTELLENGLMGESELTEIYESVRYSEKTPESDEVKKAKELSASLIKNSTK